MSGYAFYFQDDGADQITLLKNIKTGIESVSETSSNIEAGINLLTQKTPSRIISSRMLVLDSTVRDANTETFNPSFTLTQPITCAEDEYMTLSVLRFNAMHDWADIPENSQIQFQKAGGQPFTLTLGTYGKPPFNNIATAIKNAWILSGQGSGFTMDYNQNLGAYVIGYTSGLTMTVLTEDLARYMNVPYNIPIESVNNKITTGVLRAQKTVNLALCVSDVSAQTTTVFRNLNKNVLCQMPILSGSYILFNYRVYVENEQTMRITDKTINSLTFEYIDCASGLQIPLAESCLTLEINTYKI
jgi:hypothetical protein